jgi:hypothetical protein
MMFESSCQLSMAEAYALPDNRRNGQEGRKKRYDRHIEVIKETMMELEGFRWPCSNRDGN